MGLRSKLRGNSSAAVIDYDEFVEDSEDREWQQSLAAARDRVDGEAAGVAVIDHDEFVDDSNDSDWQTWLRTARDHVAALERSGRSH